MSISDEAKVALTNFNRERRTWAYALLWGGFMVGIMSFWLTNKHDDMAGVILWILRVIAVLAIGGGIFLFIPIRENEQTEEQVKQAKEKQLKTLAYGLFGPGGFFLVLCLWLSFTKGLEAFGEAVGLGMFGLIAIGSGWWLSKTLMQPISTDQFFENLAQKGQAIFLSFIGLAVVSFGLFFWLVAFKQTGWPGFPEWFGFMALGVAFLVGGVWLNAGTGDKPSGDQVRIAMIGVGVAAGAIISLMTLIRGLIWRNDVFFGGMAAWQQEGGWRFWICAYALLIGFALLFGSLLLARGEVRRQPRLRVALFGYNTFLTTLLLLGCLVVLNIVFYVRFPYTFNWTKSRGLYSLSNSSKHLLGNLNEKTKIYVTMSQGGPIYRDLKVLLNNMQTETDRIEIVEISPDREKGDFRRLFQKYPEVGRGVLLVYGPEGEATKATTKRTFIPEDKLEKQPGFHSKNKQTRLFIGEEAIMTDLQFLMEQKQVRKVYFLQGHGELDVTEMKAAPRRLPTKSLEPFGAGELVKRLKQNNYEVVGLSFEEADPKKAAKITYATIDPATKKKEIPKDAFAVVIAGASKDLELETLGALERFMKDRNGRMIVYLDVVVENMQFKAMKTTNVKGFLKQFNVEAEDKVVFGLPGFDGIPYVLMTSVPDDSDSLLGKQFLERAFPMDTLRPIKTGNTGKDYKANTLLGVERGSDQVRIWTESDMRMFVFEPQILARLVQAGRIDVSEKKIPVAATVTDPGGKPRMVVFGDAEFASNYALSTPIRDFYYAMHRSSLDWLAGRPGLGIPPKTTDSFRLANINKTRMVLYPGWLMVLGIVGLGTGIWIVRRR